MNKEFGMGMDEENIVISRKKYHQLFEEKCHWKDMYDDEHRRYLNASSLLTAVIDQHDRLRQAIMLVLERPNWVETILDTEELNNGN